jgi:exodeoxyribonuclease-5
MSNVFSDLFISQMGHTPTNDQLVLIDRMSRFIDKRENNWAFIIRGYAGTGKTTTVGAMVKALPKIGLQSVLLAPTGRAAKVLSNFANKRASTIHRAIYQSKTSPDGISKFVLAANKAQNTIFIVDEASMISDGGGLSNTGFGESRSLLDDLMEFVFSGHHCKLIFIGDTAQLPPVGMEISPALEPKFLKSAYPIELKGAELKEVVRQKTDSGILYNATKLRLALLTDDFNIKFELEGYPDVFQLQGDELEDVLNECYGSDGEDNSIVICRSNKRANLFNGQIRQRIRWMEDEIATGEYIMIVKNNYFWLDETSKAGFIANGDIAEVMRLGNTEEMYGFRFVDATIRLVDYPDEPLVETKLLLNSLKSESPALEPSDFKLLYERVLEDYADEPNRKKKYELLKKNPYYNGLQIKFAYAITCHKSQGGQWKNVIIDQGYLTEEMIDVAYVRWLYTAITRATSKLYLLNFNERFFS